MRNDWKDLDINKLLSKKQKTKLCFYQFYWFLCTVFNVIFFTQRISEIIYSDLKDFSPIFKALQFLFRLRLKIFRFVFSRH